MEEEYQFKKYSHGKREIELKQSVGLKYSLIENIFVELSAEGRFWKSFESKKPEVQKDREMNT